MNRSLRNESPGDKEWTKNVRFFMMRYRLYMCVPQNLYVEAPVSHVTIFGDRTIMEAIKVKWGHKAGALIH